MPDAAAAAEEFVTRTIKVHAGEEEGRHFLELKVEGQDTVRQEYVSSAEAQAAMKRVLSIAINLQDDGAADEIVTEHRRRSQVEPSELST